MSLLHPKCQTQRHQRLLVVPRRGRFLPGSPIQQPLSLSLPGDSTKFPMKFPSSITSGKERTRNRQGHGQGGLAHSESGTRNDCSDEADEGMSCRRARNEQPLHSGPTDSSRRDWSAACGLGRWGLRVTFTQPSADRPSRLAGTLGSWPCPAASGRRTPHGTCARKQAARRAALRPCTPLGR